MMCMWCGVNRVDSGILLCHECDLKLHKGVTVKKNSDWIPSYRKPELPLVKRQTKSCKGQMSLLKG